MLETKTQSVPRGVSRLFAVALLALLGTACAQTTYRTAEEGGGTALPFVSREVHYELNSEAIGGVADCVTVLSVSGTQTPELAELVEDSVTRHAMVRVPQVIAPWDRGRLERDLALDLGDQADRRFFARAQSCPLFLEPMVEGGGDTYLVVWSQQSIELALRLFRAADGETLWQASHQAQRGDGGLPLSIVSVGVSAFQAGRHIADEDVLPSLVDDAVRRIFVTFPDLR